MQAFRLRKDFIIIFAESLPAERTSVTYEIQMTVLQSATFNDRL